MINPGDAGELGRFRTSAPADESAVACIKFRPDTGAVDWSYV